MMHIIESIPVPTIQYVQVPDFMVEDIKIRSLNGGIQKKFTSQASSYSVVFKWKFGDEADPSLYTTTHDRTIIHGYKKAGTYIVSHQACLLDLPCCYNNTIPWCTQKITVSAPTEMGVVPILGLGLLFGLLFKKECEDYKNKKDCDKHDTCQWIEERKMCIKKERRVPIIPVKVPAVPTKVYIPPTKEEIARLLSREPKLKTFSEEDQILVAELRKRGAVGEPYCTGEECRIGRWIALADKKGKPPVIIHDP